MSDHGRDGRMRGQGGSGRMMIPGGAEGGRNQDGADWLTGQGGVMGSAAGSS